MIKSLRDRINVNFKKKVLSSSTSQADIITVAKSSEGENKILRKVKKV